MGRLAAEGSVVKRGALLITCVLGGVPTAAHAQVSNNGVLDQALNQYRTAAEGWQNAAQGAATTLFWSLAAISLAWTMGQLALRRAEIGEFFAELIRYLLFTGFWAWMLANGPAHAQLIVDSMVRLASSASAENRLTPSGVLDVGFHILDRTLTQSAISSPLTSTIGIVAALGILVVLALAAVNMLVSLIACWIVAYGGLIVLGFGGSRWTSDMAINYYRMVLSLGLQVLAMILLVGMGESFLRNYFNTLEQSVSLHELAVLLVVSLVLLVTVNRVPALLGTLASGSSPQYALGGGAGAGAAMSAISTIGGVAAWSSVAGKTAADSAGKLAVGAGSLASAVTAATTAGASAAVSSLFDGFRSGSSTDRASGTAGGAGGGSVFPAPGSSPSASAGASSSASPGPQQSPSVRRAGRGAAPVSAASSSVGQPSEPTARAADKAGSRTSVHSQQGAGTDSRSAAHNRGRGRPFTRPDAPLATADASRDITDASMNPRRPGARVAGEGASGHGTLNPHDSSSKAAKHAASAWSAPSERLDAGSKRPATDATAATASSTPSPAGTFAHSQGTAPAVSGSTTALPAGTSALTSATPSSPRPGTAIAAATRAAASLQEIPFSVTASSDSVDATKAQPPAQAGETSERAELPAAYSQQTSVDIEAEVAAFRDRD
jgi:type IV secretion system protein TrbL